jgi:transcriptional regulator with XRE-family HTH domain
MVYLFQKEGEQMTRRETPLDYPFRVRLKQLRNEKNLTQKQIGDAVDLSPITVSGWEIGRSLPDAQTLPLLADFFGVSIDFLLGREETAPPDRTHQAIFAPVFGSLRYRWGQLHCLDYRGTHPLPAELQEYAGTGGILVVVMPSGEHVALWVGLPFEEGELCGVLMRAEPLQLRRVKQVTVGNETGYELQDPGLAAPDELYLGEQSDSVHIIGPCAGVWRGSPRLQKE